MSTKSSAEEYVNHIQSVIEDESLVQSTVNTLKPILHSSPPDVALFLHAFVVVKAYEHKQCVDLVKSLDIDENLMVQYFTGSTALDCGLLDQVVNRKYYQKVIGTNTRLMTYDLVDENPLGFINLSATLFGYYGPDLWSQVTGIMGKYSLEPYRVLSICILHSYYFGNGDNRQTLKMDWIIEVLQHTKWAESPDFNQLYFSLPRNEAYALLTAKIVRAGVMDYKTVLKYLYPGEDAFELFENSWRQENSGTAPKQNSLAMAMPLVDDDEDEEEMQEFQNDQMEDDKVVNDDEPAEGSANAIAEQEEPVIDEAAENEKKIAQVLTFLEFMGRVLVETLSKLDTDEEDDFVVADIITFVKSHLVTSKTNFCILRGLSKYSIQKIDQAESAEEFVEVVEACLPLVTGGMNRELWNVFNDKLLQYESEIPASDIFRKYGLSSIDMHPENQSYLKHLNGVDRLAMYTDLQQRVASEEELVKFRFLKAEKNTRTILKRLTNQNAESETVPSLMEEFGVCPLPALSVFIKQVESYNIGRLVAKNAAKMPSLALDMLPLIIMQQLTTEGKEVRKTDGLHENRWFKLLAQFTGEVAVSCPNFDFIMVIKLVLAQFKQDNYSLIEILEQILFKLSGFPETENLNVLQIVALNSLPPLNQVIRSDITGQYTNFIDNLTKGIPNEKLSQTILMALVSGYLIQVQLETDPKVISSRLDKLRSLINVFTDVCGFSIDLNLEQLLAEEIPFPIAVAVKRSNENGLSEEDKKTINTEVAKIGSIESAFGELFWSLDLKIVHYSDALYKALLPTREQSKVEKAILSHKLKFKITSEAIEQKKAELFNGNATEVKDMVLNLFLPRALLSAPDAVFVSKFVQLLHKANPPNFDILQIGKQLFDIPTLISIFSRSTNGEIENFSLLVSDLFKFFIDAKIDTDSLRQIHQQLTDSLLKMVHPAANYTIVNNWLLFLQRAGSVYPMFEFDGNKILKRVQVLTIGLKDDDLLTASKSIFPQLKHKKTTWVLSANSVQDKFAPLIAKQYDQLLTRIRSSMAIVPLTVDNPQPKPEPSTHNNEPRSELNGESGNNGDHESENEDFDGHENDTSEEDDGYSPNAQGNYDDEENVSGGEYSSNEGEYYSDASVGEPQSESVSSMDVSAEPPEPKTEPNEPNDNLDGLEEPAPQEQEQNFGDSQGKLSVKDTGAPDRRDSRYPARKRNKRY